MGEKGRTAIRPYNAKHITDKSIIPKELLVHYNVGSIFVTDKNGAALSADELSRLRFHIYQFRKLAVESNIFNKIWEIRSDALRFPNEISLNINLLDSDLLVPVMTEYMISLDIDAMTNEADICELVPDNLINTTIEFRIVHDNGFEEIKSFTKILDKMNSSTISLGYDDRTSISKVYITSITVDADVAAGDIYRLILYSILFTGK